MYKRDPVLIECEFYYPLLSFFYCDLKTLQDKEDRDWFGSHLSLRTFGGKVRTKTTAPLRDHLEKERGKSETKKN